MKELDQGGALIRESVARLVRVLEEKVSELRKEMDEVQHRLDELERERRSWSN